MVVAQQTAVTLLAGCRGSRAAVRRVARLSAAGAWVDDATWERGRGWALSIALIPLPCYQHTNPELAASARHVIGEVLADRQRPA